MVVGCRVIRGPDWTQGDKDGGRNHVGTVVSTQGNTKVTVQWDMGEKTLCRVGESGKHDILVLDNRPTGVMHPGVECVRCEDGAIVGTRWRCNECKSANLCTTCYNKDGHVIKHDFSRIDYPGAEPVFVAKRSLSQRARALGVYTHAEVVRGPDWAYADKDGGSGQKGDVEDTFVTGKGSASCLSVKVKWENGTVGTYRMGHGGKIDLCCKEEAAGIEFYPEHLAYLDVAGLTKVLQSQQGSPGTSSANFAVGDRVCVAVSTVDLRQLCNGRGFTRQLTGEVGVVKKLAADGEVAVEFGGDTFNIPQDALKKLASFSTGDQVRVVDSRDKVYMLQSVRGGWTASMSQAVGQVGKVTMVDEDGDVVVNFKGKKHVFHPACLEPVTGDSKETKLPPAETAKPEIPARRITKPAPPPKPPAQAQGAEGGKSNEASSQAFLDMGSDEVPMGDDFYHKDSKRATASKPDFSPRFDSLAMLQALLHGTQNIKENFLKAVIDGKDGQVKQLLALDKSLVKMDVEGIPCLSLASHFGHAGIVSMLLDAGADVNAKDKKGNSSLLVALSEQKGDVARVLIERGANLNATGQNNLSPMHLAVHKNMIGHLRLLLKNGANPNVQDMHGDTPLHDAIQLKSDAMAEIIIGDPRLNVWMTNNKNFTTLAFACLKEHTRAVEKLLDREPNLANGRMEGDGYYPLHICAVNNHVEVAKLLFLKGRPNVNAKNNKSLTPLHLATLCTHINMVKLLLIHNADIHLKDADGDTAMHLCLKGRQSEADALLALLGMQSSEKLTEKLEIAQLLIEKGADVDVPNNDGLTPVTSCTNLRLREAVRQFATQHAAKNQTGQVRPSTANAGHMSRVNATQKCLSCSMKIADSCFLPCGHQYACLSCVGNYKRCPVCRREVTQVLDLRRNRVQEDVDCKVQ